MLLKYLVIILSVGTTVVHCHIRYLPKNVKPLHYDITIEPNVTDVGKIPSKFLGQVIIQLRALENTNNITIHAVKLDLDTDSITISGNGESVPIKGFSTNSANEVFIISLQKNLISQQLYTLTIGKFIGIFQSNSRGLYKATYFDSYGKRKIVAVTHFQPTFARYAFPCFDEPQLKAKFVINLIRNEEYNSVSNEDLDRTEKLGKDRYKDVFKETPLMSTYTVAFAVSEFKHTERKEKQRIYAHKSAFEKNELELPLKMSIELLKIMEEYIGIEFTLKKMDSFAVPRGFFIHFAMENWGLITYREENIRFTNSSGIFTLKKSISYIAREIAHQWFGNLVTHASWDYIWISKSFATYFQYFLTSKVLPEWRIMELFVHDVVQESLFNEETQGTHELNYRISRYGQFPPLHIMYEKGSAIVWMMTHFLTESLFRKAIHNYLFDRQFQNVVPEDFYRLIQKTIDKEGANHLLGNLTMSEIFGTWDSLQGYPIINVTRDYATGNVVLTQHAELTNKKHVWKIPINYVISTGKINFEDTKADFWMVNKTMTINLDKEGWLILNKQHTGYYRVNYDPENWERIIQVLNSDDFKKIHVLNRAQLINDAFYLAFTDQLPLDIAFRLAEYLKREKDYVAFASFYSALSYYCPTYTYYVNQKQSEIDYFENHPLRNEITNTSSDTKIYYLVYQKYIVNILNNIYTYLGEKEKPDDTVLDRMHRTELEQKFYDYFH